MSKLLSALVAAGFAFSLTTALAQNVKSDSDKAKGQEDVMQKKEQGTDGAAQGQRNRPGTDDGRSAQGAGNSQGAGSDNSSAAQGTKKNGETGQSNSSSDTGNASPGSSTSGQSGTDNTQTPTKKRRMQQ